MNVWVIGRGYPTPANKMWGSFELEQAKLLARYGYEVSYIALTLSFFNRKDPRGLRIFSDDGVKVYAYSHLYFPGKLGLYLESFEDHCWKLLFDSATSESGEPDIIHVHYPSMIGSINMIESYRKKGVKVYATEHWSRVLTNKLKTFELNRLKYYANYANCIATVGKPLKDSIMDLVEVSVPMTIIPNIVSPIFFKERSDNTHPFTFICVGRLVKLKQFDVVIQQFQRVFKNVDVRIMFVGSGIEKQNLEKIAKDDSRISFAGTLSPNSVASLIAKSSVLVSFSKYETFAAPVAEAWACGKPIIVSNTSGIASYVNDDLGIVVNNTDPNMLGKAMMQVYEKQTSFNSDAIRKFAFDNFSDNSIIRQLVSMYSGDNYE